MYAGTLFLVQDIDDIDSYDEDLTEFDRIEISEPEISNRNKSNNNNYKEKSKKKTKKNVEPYKKRPSLSKQMNEIGSGKDIGKRFTKRTEEVSELINKLL